MHECEIWGSHGGEMEVANSSDTLVPMCQTAHYYIPEDSDL